MTTRKVATQKNEITLGFMLKEVIAGRQIRTYLLVLIFFDLNAEDLHGNQYIWLLNPNQLRSLIKKPVAFPHFDYRICHFYDVNALIES